jgi:hypothetical protein
MGAHSTGVEYGHPPIKAQLDLGLRQLEFDPYADTKGGLYAAPYAKDPARLAVMNRPGAKVLHAPVVDARTLCLASDPLLRPRWRPGPRSHPGHDRS